MKFAIGMAMLTAMFLVPQISYAQVPVGRWEIVHTSGDNSAQTALYPGSFSTFLLADGTGYTYGSFSSSICVVDAQTFNIVPTWALLPGFTNVFTITITVDNLGLGPNVSFIYTGVYNPLTPVPGNPSQHIPAITGTYFVTGDASACSVATSPSSSGNFVATLLPTISSGSASGSLDNLTAEDGSPFDSPVDATITFSAPPAPGQIAGTVSLTPNPTLGTNACFATTSGVVDPLTINSDLSTQSGVAEYIYAEGFDPQGVPTKLFLNGFSVNLYLAPNSDPNAIQITTDEWAVAAAIGEDNPSAGTAGVSNDGTNNDMVFLYGVVGGACDGAGGIDLPFHYVSGTPIVHKHKKQVRSGGAIRGRGRIEPGENWRQSFPLPETRLRSKTK